MVREWRVIGTAALLAAIAATRGNEKAEAMGPHVANDLDPDGMHVITAVQNLSPKDPRAPLRRVCLNVSTVSNEALTVVWCDLPADALHELVRWEHGKLVTPTSEYASGEVVEAKTAD